MSAAPPARPAAPRPGSAGLEHALSATEQRLSALHDALLSRDALAIERQADELQRALSHAASTFMAAARQGGVPPALRHRLASASAQVASQRESLARATASLGRALDALLPAAPAAAPGLYSSAGAAQPRAGGASLLA
ncbi:hypothetical protein BurJ1DRAFT_4077 [Burkholderiales bacterium JOSHI_001]|nr:hypothetical protein BurJ1DRAFT_4077 [Burkholderiales bacterium JOSHI_001]